MSQPLINPIPDLLLRLIKLIGLLLSFQLADQLFKYFDHVEALAAFITFDVQFDLSIRQDSDFKFTLRHRLSLPLPDRQMNRAILIGFLFGDYKTPGTDFFEQLLVNVLLNHRMTEFLAESAQGFGTAALP